MLGVSISMGEPFISPAWGSNLAVFSSPTGVPVAQEDARQYIARSTGYARKHEIYLVPERFIIDDVQCMCLISPQGEVLGAQRALYLNRSGSFTREKGSRIDIIETELGNIYLCVDVDIYHPETSKVAAGMGAEILICSQYLTKRDYSVHKVVSGVWSVAQSNNIYSVGVCNSFNTICAPKELTEHKDGFLAPPTERMPVTAKFSVESLEKLPEKQRLHPDFYQRHREQFLKDN